MTKCVANGLRISQNSWNRLTKGLELLLGSSWASASSEDMDLDMFEDAQFTKSRRHFWSIRTLNDCITKIEDTIRTWHQLRDEWVDSYANIGVRLPQGLKVGIAEGEKHCVELAKICQRQKALLAEVSLRRDGLFNASAVMESLTLEHQRDLPPAYPSVDGSRGGRSHLHCDSQPQLGRWKLRKAILQVQGTYLATYVQRR
ncbi:MAG: hypothetical protein Q9170_006231 [Blastenia crenularia]